MGRELGLLSSAEAEIGPPSLFFITEQPMGRELGLLSSAEAEIGPPSLFVITEQPMVKELGFLSSAESIAKYDDFSRSAETFGEFCLSINNGN